MVPLTLDFLLSPGKSRKEPTTAEVLINSIAGAFELEGDENEASSSPQHVHTVPAHFQHHEPTAHACDLYRSWGPVKYQHHNHPLHLMVSKCQDV